MTACGRGEAGRPRKQWTFASSSVMLWLASTIKSRGLATRRELLPRQRDECSRDRYQH